MLGIEGYWQIGYVTRTREKAYQGGLMQQGTWWESLGGEEQWVVSSSLGQLPANSQQGAGAIRSTLEVN